MHILPHVWLSSEHVSSSRSNDRPLKASGQIAIFCDITVRWSINWNMKCGAQLAQRGRARWFHRLNNVFSSRGSSHWVSDVHGFRAINQAAGSDLLQLWFYEQSFGFYEDGFSASVHDSVCETSGRVRDITGLLPSPRLQRGPGLFYHKACFISSLHSEFKIFVSSKR